MTPEDRQLEAFGRQLADRFPEPSAAAIASSRQRSLALFEGRKVWDAIDTPIGRLYLLAGEQGLEQVSFAASQAEFLRQAGDPALLQRDRQRMHQYAAAFDEYFKRGQPLTGIRYNLTRATKFQRAVLGAILRIPAGQVWSYKQLAEAIGKPRAARAVGQALGSNPLPIVLPCHRVIASDGGLGGYGGGVRRKRMLLSLEGASVNYS